MLTKEIISKALPGAQIIEKKASDSDNPALVEATAPDLETLVSKYFRKKDADTASDSNDAQATGADTETVSVDLGGVRRTAIIDKNKKTLRGMSG
jgi:hypothetical protein